MKIETKDVLIFFLFWVAIVIIASMMGSRGHESESFSCGGDQECIDDNWGMDFTEDRSLIMER